MTGGFDTREFVYVLVCHVSVLPQRDLGGFFGAPVLQAAGRFADALDVPEQDVALALIGAALLAVGFGFKVAAVPFHMWTPDAYEGAPIPITAFMSTAVKAAGFAAFLRVFLTGFGGMYETWAIIAITLAAFTMIGANLTALVEGNLKRMLAYSSIAHAGYLLVALAAGNELGAASFLFYLVVYTLMTVGSFAVVMVIAGRGEQRLDLPAYSGIAWKYPFLGVVMTIFLLSLAGFPFTGGFIGKVFILRAAIDRGLVLLSVALVLTSLLSYYYYLRVAWYMWFRDADASDAGADIPVTLTPALRAALVLAAVGVVFLGAAWAKFEGQTYLALVGHGFLLFVALSTSLSVPPWPFLAVLFVLDLAIGIAALYLKRGALLAGAAVMSQVVLTAWSAVADEAPWPNVALAMTLAVAAYACVFYILAMWRGGPPAAPGGG